MPGSPFGQSPGLPPGSRYLKLIKIAIMKKIIFAALILGIIALSWQPHCEHVFVAVEQPEIKIQTSFPTMTTTEVKHPLTGKHEGRELVCVKCLYRQKQIIDYGERSIIAIGDNGNTTNTLSGGSLMTVPSSSGKLTILDTLK